MEHGSSFAVHSVLKAMSNVPNEPTQRSLGTLMNPNRP